MQNSSAPSSAAAVLCLANCFLVSAAASSCSDPPSCCWCRCWSLLPRGGGEWREGVLRGGGERPVGVREVGRGHDLRCGRRAEGRIFLGLVEEACYG